MLPACVFIPIKHLKTSRKAASARVGFWSMLISCCLNSAQGQVLKMGDPKTRAPKVVMLSEESHRLRGRQCFAKHPFETTEQKPPETSPGTLVTGAFRQAITQRHSVDNLTSPRQLSSAFVCASGFNEGCLLL